MREHKILVDTAKCIGCGLCGKDCPAGNIKVTDKKAVIKTQECIKCGHCSAVCPKAAITLTNFEEKPAELNKKTVLNPEQLLAALKTRRSIRQFKGQTVAPETVARIIEAGRLTPTGGNAQDVSYIVLDHEKKKKHCEAIAVRLFRRLIPLVRLINPTAKNIVIDDHFFFKKAPVVIAVVSKDKVNAALAASNMELMAEACGLGVLYSGFFAMAAKLSPSLRRALGLKRREKVVTALVLGYSGVTYYRTVQKEAAAVRRL